MVPSCQVAGQGSAGTQWIADGLGCFFEVARGEDELRGGIVVGDASDEVEAGDLVQAVVGELEIRGEVQLFEQRPSFLRSDGWNVLMASVSRQVWVNERTNSSSLTNRVLARGLLLGAT